MQVNLEQQKSQGTRPMKSKRERGRGRLYLGLLLPHGWASSRERSLTPPLPTSSWCRCVVSWRLAASIGVLRSPAAQHEHQQSNKVWGTRIHSCRIESNREGRREVAHFFLEWVLLKIHGWVSSSSSLCIESSCCVREAGTYISSQGREEEEIQEERRRGRTCMSSG